MAEPEGSDAEVMGLLRRISELEAELAAKPILDRTGLYQLTDAAPWGVLAISCDGHLDYANPAVQRWMTGPAPGTGQALEEALTPSLLAVLAAPVEAACAGEASRMDRQIPDSAGQVRHVQIRVTPRSVGARGVSGCVAQISDITEANALDDSLVESEARLRLAMDAGQMAVWEFDVATGRLLAGDQLARLLGFPPGASPTAEDIRAGYAPDDWDRLSQRARENLARGEYGVESELRHRGPDGVERTLLLRLEMIRDATGQVVKGHGVLVDITERKKSETAQQLLVNELNHRVKNTLAIVQSMARQSFRGRQDPAVAWQEFSDRLVSLAKAHDLLTAESWASADISVLVADATASVRERLNASGPELRLTPKLALSLSMALHELLTNAAKYGALSNATGSVAVNWEVSDGKVLFTWREGGGPPVEPPDRRGFGTRLLQHALATDVNGRVTLEFAPTGLICQLEAPLDTLDITASYE